MAGSEEVDAETGADAESGATARGDNTDREVIVPLRLYKTVTVFSTLFAVVFVLAGFVLLDGATNRATAEFAEIDPVLGILGLGSLVFGAVIYAFSTRFRTEQMGKAQDDSAEDSNNG
jgi:hypothetical protein